MVGGEREAEQGREREHSFRLGFKCEADADCELKLERGLAQSWPQKHVVNGR